MKIKNLKVTQNHQLNENKLKPIFISLSLSLGFCFVCSAYVQNFPPAFRHIVTRSIDLSTKSLAHQLFFIDKLVIDSAYS